MHIPNKKYVSTDPTLGAREAARCAAAEARAARLEERVVALETRVAKCAKAKRKKKQQPDEV